VYTKENILISNPKKKQFHQTQIYKNHIEDALIYIKEYSTKGISIYVFQKE